MCYALQFVASMIPPGGGRHPATPLASAQHLQLRAAVELVDRQGLRLHLVGPLHNCQEEVRNHHRPASARHQAPLAAHQGRHSDIIAQLVPVTRRLWQLTKVGKVTSSPSSCRSVYIHDPLVDTDWLRGFRVLKINYGSGYNCGVTFLL